MQNLSNHLSATISCYFASDDGLFMRAILEAGQVKWACGWSTLHTAPDGELKPYSPSAQR